MTPERKAEIQQRCDAATPGPWMQGDWRGQCYKDHFPHPAGAECHYEYTLRHGDYADGYVSLEGHRTLIGGNEDGVWLNAADAEFIAHARQDVPDLLAALAALQQRVERLTGALRTVSRSSPYSEPCWCAEIRPARGHSDRCEQARAALADAGPGVGEGE